MTGDKAAFHGAQLRLFRAAALACIGAARVEAAAGGRVNGAWKLACEEHMALGARAGVCLGYGVYEKARIGVDRLGIDFVCVADFAQLAEEHHTHAIRNEMHHGKIMAYKKIRQPALML